MGIGCCSFGRHGVAKSSGRGRGRGGDNCEGVTFNRIRLADLRRGYRGAEGSGRSDFAEKRGRESLSHFGRFLRREGEAEGVEYGGVGGHGRVQNGRFDVLRHCVELLAHSIGDLQRVLGISHSAQ